ncbi:MAG: AEC family transporter [Candidatus Phosphoribacter sp.]|nr:AEC family transporter [Actinomycetales bacterium]
MLGALQGFSTILAVVLVGWLLAHFGVLRLEARQILADVAFFVASPALLLVVLSKAPVSQVLSGGLAVAAMSSVAVMLVAAAIAHWRWRVATGETVMAALCAGYVNSGNLGLPIALYVLGNVTYAAPVLLYQLLVLTPVSMSVLDAQRPGAKPGLGARLAGLLRNPITIGASVGLVLSVAQITLPPVLLDPITLIGNLAVPCMLLAFGVALRLGQRPGEAIGRIGTLVALKLVGMPLVAAGLGAALGMRGKELFAVVVMAALPTAQNIFTYSLRYGRAVYLTRDAIFVSTLGSVPAILLVALVYQLGG